MEILRGHAFRYDCGVFYGWGEHNSGHAFTQAREVSHKSGIIDGAVGSWSSGCYRIRSVEFRIPTNIIVSPFYIEGRAAIDDNGSIYVGCYTRDPETLDMNAGERRTCSVLWKSTDGGENYEFASIIARGSDAPWGNIGPCEPALVFTKDGELVCVMRTGAVGSQHGTATADDMILARSLDGGNTWTHQRMFIPGVMPKLLVMSNGVMVCAFGRPGNNLVFSLDGGRSWGRETVITPPDIPTSGYPDIMEVSPGRLLVVYDAFDVPTASRWLWEPPPPVNALWGMFVDVKRLF